MKHTRLRPAAWLLSLGLAGCAGASATTGPAPTEAVRALTTESANDLSNLATPATEARLTEEPRKDEPFRTVSEQFADLRVLRYQVPGFEKLEPRQKELLYYLYEAALAGRDITYDQNYRHNLRVRRTLEALWPLNQQRMAATSNTQQVEEAQKLNVYTKRVWFSNGVHHHYSTRKFVPECSKAYFAELVRAADPKTLPLLPGESVDRFLELMTPIVFDANLDPKRVNQEAGQDLVKTSATNF